MSGVPFRRANQFRPMKRYDFECLSVLVVDDNKQMRTLVQSILYSLGTKKVKQAESAEEAYKELFRGSLDFIVLDWHMDPVDGIEFTRWVRSRDDSPKRCVPIIMLTGFSEVERVIEARDAGVNEFLAKPISPHALYARIVSIVEHPRQFIKTDTFFGPDRRRRNLGPPDDSGERRVHDDRDYIYEQVEDVEDVEDTAEVG